MADQTTFCFKLSFMLCSLGMLSSEGVLLEIQRYSIKQGFHRDIQTALSIQTADIMRPLGKSCSVLLIENLPSGLYIDLYQLDALASFGGPQVLADRHVDIEAPEYLSKPHELYVFIALPVATPPTSSHITVTVSLPVHVRYHRPAADPKITHASVIMYHPRVLLNCSSKGFQKAEVPCDAQNTSLCSWTEVLYKSDSSFLEMQVPVGHEQDVCIVLYGTIVVTVMGCSVLLYIITFYNQWKVKVKDS